MNSKILLSIFLIVMMVDFSVSRYIRGRYDLSRRFSGDVLQKRGHWTEAQAKAECMEKLESIAAAKFICDRLNLKWHNPEDDGEDEDYEGDDDGNDDYKRGLRYYKPANLWK